MKNNRAITLVALVITIIILLILAGITISQLTGNGLFENAKLAKEKSTRAEMVESLTLALQELQLDKKGKATIEDITQEWINSKLTEYINIVTDDTENNSKIITMEKDGIIVNYILDEKLGVTESTEPVAKFKIQVTDPIVSTNTSATVSDAAGKLSRGTASYINFTAALDVDGGECTISPELPYKVLENGTYTFTVTGTHEGVTITKEVKVNVNQYLAPTGYVQYDAGDWTEEEIAELKTKSLYDININKTANRIFKLTDASGLNYTFGGFTYKEDTANKSYIDNGTISTSRNGSVSCYNSGTEYKPTYSGWQILTKTTKKDEDGNTIKNEDGTERIYVTKIMHAGQPENFVYCYASDYAIDAYRADYLLSNGKRQIEYSTLKDGTIINTRKWDMYKDKELDDKEYIKEVHIMTYDEAYALTNNTYETTGIRRTGSCYWLGEFISTGSSGFCFTLYGGRIAAGNYNCYGIRPVVEMNDGVYIASGDGTAASPYVLGKE